MKLLILIIFVSLGLEAKELALPNIKNFQEAVKKTGNPPCMTCQEQLSNETKTSELYSPFNRKTIELSVLSSERALEVFNLLKNDEDNSFNYPPEGCFARAHRMAQLMDEMDIVSGKVFLEGVFHMESKYEEYAWSYHTASVVLVRDKNNKLTPTIFDPSLFERPVTIEEFKNRLMKDSRSKFHSQYFTRRYNYDPDNRHDDLSNYDEDQLEDMKKVIAEKRRLGEMLEMLESSAKTKTKTKPSGKK